MVTARNKTRAAVAAVVGVIGAVTLAGVLGACGVADSAGSGTASSQSGTATSANSTMSSSEIDVATTVAFKEAESSIPGADGTPRSAAPSLSGTAGGGITWPSNVSEVAAIASTRGQAETYVGASESADVRPVVAVQLIGDFVVARSGPPPVENPNSTGSSAPGADSSANGNWARGQVMTVVADASSGRVLDFGLDPSSDPKVSLPNPQLIYRR